MYDDLVSIVIPVCNGERFIEETVQSVLAQLYSKWELIIVNDGSRDGTADVLKKFASDKRIKVFETANAGVSEARNFGASHTLGSLLCFLDADDTLTEDCLEQRVAFAKAGSFAFIHNDVQVFDSAGIKTGETKSGLSGNVLESLLCWEETVIPGPSSIMITRDCYDRIGGFDRNFSTAADQDFFIRAAQKYEIGRISKVLSMYRVHPANMHKNIALMERDHIGVYRKALGNNLFKSFWFGQRCFSNLYLILAASWWTDGRNKPRALSFVCRAVFAYPMNSMKIFKRLLHGKGK